MLEGIAVDQLTPATIWRSLDGDTRTAAAEAMYQTAETRAEADFAICRAIRFRDSAVRKLPTARRVGYLLKSVPVDEHLAGSLLLALHVQRRSALLEDFLAALDIPNEGGMIDPDHEMTAPDADRLRDAVAGLRERHDEEQVRLYLASLIALDRDIWGGCAEHLDPTPTPPAG